MRISLRIDGYLTVTFRGVWEERLIESQIRKAAERPIIFIAHSLGGLVVKRVTENPTFELLESD